MTQALPKIVIIGATSLIAEHCARLWLKQAVELTLVARDLEKAERIAQDLRVRSPQSVIHVQTLDFLDPPAIQRYVDRFYETGFAHIVLIAQGTLPNQSDLQQDLPACAAALMINGISPVLFAEAFAGHMQRLNVGTLVLLGSVAGERGRKSNYIYGSAKGLVTRYVQGLQHRLAQTRVKVVLVKPGPTETPMTAGMAVPLAPVDQVAHTIVVGIERGKSVIYAPAKWALIMMVIRHLPACIFNKLNI